MFKTFIHAPDISPHKVTQPTNFCTLQNMKNTAVQPLKHREKTHLHKSKFLIDKQLSFQQSFALFCICCHLFLHKILYFHGGEK